MKDIILLIIFLNRCTEASAGKESIKVRQHNSTDRSFAVGG